MGRVSPGSPWPRVIAVILAGLFLAAPILFAILPVLLIYPEFPVHAGQPLEVAVCLVSLPHHLLRIRAMNGAVAAGFRFFPTMRRDATHR